jgi:hypothetical protein
MNPRLVLLALVIAGPATAAGWHDYALPIAPGFTIYRSNSFEVCLGEADGVILICPKENGLFGPIAAYAVTDAAILTKHFGVTRNERNPSIPEGDPTKEFFFLTSRKDKQITGPLTADEWRQRRLASLAAVTWVEPRNPDFWFPLFGDMMFLGYLVIIVLYSWWPVALAVLAAVLLLLYRRKRSGRGAA